MAKVIQEVLEESMKAIAQHYADKMIAQGITPTKAQIEESLQNNWEKVSKEVSELYAQVMAQLEAA